VSGDITRWYLAAAVFWFEGLGLMALTVVYFLSPFACWGDRLEGSPPANDSCAVGEAPFVQDGSLVAWLIGLLAIGFGAVLYWLAANDRPRLLAYGCIGVGHAAMWAAISDPLFGMLVFVWTGVPALLLLGAGFRLLRGPADPT
jgi:hypothetical protein